MAAQTQSSSFASAAGSNASRDDVRVPTKNAGAVDLCRVTVVSETCSQERNCSECMDVNVPERPDGCFLDATSGICQSFGQLPIAQQASNGSNATSASNQQWQALETKNLFWSTHRQYCKPLDSACVLCAKMAANPQFTPSADELKHVSADWRVCYGDDGCICVAACQTADRISFTSTRCPVPPTSQPAGTQSIMGSPSIQVTIVAVLGCFVLVRCIGEYLRIRWARQRADRCAAVVGFSSDGSGRNARPARERAANSLRLSGWVAWQHELRELEKNGELRYVDLQTPIPRETAELSSSSHVEADHDVVMLEPRSSF
ncbi:hypothetical protein Gpo141_00009779 [Globisporangium polare]